MCIRDRPKYEIKVTDKKYPECPFTIEKLNEKYLRSLPITEEKYRTVDQCKQRCEYEVALHTNMAQSVEVTCLPIYSLNVGSLVYLNYPSQGIEGKFAVVQISCDLNYDGLMTFHAYKIYQKDVSE